MAHIHSVQTWPAERGEVWYRLEALEEQVKAQKAMNEKLMEALEEHRKSTDDLKLVIEGLRIKTGIIWLFAASIGTTIGASAKHIFESLTRGHR
jgi:hypothetical protein